jgi:hypothetical protein
MDFREITRDEFRKACPEAIGSARAEASFYASEPYYGIVESGGGRSAYFIFRCINGAARQVASEEILPDPEHAMRGRLNALHFDDAANEKGFR